MRTDEFESKVVRINARQWTGITEAQPLGNASEIIGWVLDNGGAARWHDPAPEFEAPEQFIAIDTLEGTMRASVGDWIIRGTEGEFYPCKPSVFERKYRSVSS